MEGVFSVTSSTTKFLSLLEEGLFKGVVKETKFKKQNLAVLGNGGHNSRKIRISKRLVSLTMYWTSML